MARIGRPTIIIDVVRMAAFVEQALAAVVARLAQRLKLAEDERVPIAAMRHAHAALKSQQEFFGTVPPAWYPRLN